MPAHGERDRSFLAQEHLPMRFWRPLIVVAVLHSSVSSLSGAEPVNDDWSPTVHGLQARVVLVQKAKVAGTRKLVPCLELQNVSDNGEPMHINCDKPHIKFELVDANGKMIRDGALEDRSGPHSDPGIISLPYDSSIRISMDCNNWGVSRNQAAMINTDSGTWTLKPEEKGRVYLRMTIHRDATKDEVERFWDGKIQVTTKVNWKETD